MEERLLDEYKEVELEILNGWLSMNDCDREYFKGYLEALVFAIQNAGFDEFNSYNRRFKDLIQAVDQLRSVVDEYEIDTPLTARSFGEFRKQRKDELYCNFDPPF